MKKIGATLVFFLILQIFFFVWNAQNQKYLVSLLGLKDTSQVKMLKVKKANQKEEKDLYYIGFVISREDYHKNTLSYRDKWEKEKMYEGKIENKKEEFLENQYHCVFQSVVYDKETKQNLKECIMIQNLLLINAGILVIIALMALGNAFRGAGRNIKEGKKDDNIRKESSASISDRKNMEDYDR